MAIATAEVFRTNVEEAEQSKQLIEILLEHFPHAHINFDLQDCDRILRIEGKDVVPEKVVALLNASRFLCEVLE